MNTVKRTLSVLLAVCLLLSLALTALADPPAFSDPADAAAFIRGSMVAREESAVFLYLAPKAAIGELNSENLYNYFSALCDEFDERIFVPSDGSDEGDYLRSQLSQHGYGYRVSYYPQDTTVSYTITATASYYTDAAQEAEVTTAVSNALQALDLAGKSDYEKVRAITDYICGTVTYDDENLYDDAYTLKYSAYAAIINGTAVCQGYAALFYRMALEAGLDARVVTGTADNGEEIGRHAWNIVRVNGTYYYHDVTWIDGTGSDDYFLKGPAAFADHTPDAKFATAAFLAQYTIATEDFDPASAQACAHRWDDGAVTRAATYTADGEMTFYCVLCGAARTEPIPRLTKPATPTGVKAAATAAGTITVSWQKAAGATIYYVYRYKGDTKKYEYIGASTGTSYKATGLSGGTNYYFKVRSVNKADGTPYYGAYSAAVSAQAVSAPAAPQNVKAAASGEKQITISWTAVSGATQYNIYRYNGTSKTYVYKGTTYATAARPTQYVDKNLNAGTNYHYKVVAVKKTADYTLVSAKSADASAKALGTPGVPKNVKAVSNAAKTVTVSWSAVNGATQYNVYRYRGSDKQYHYIGTTFATADKPTQYTDTGLHTGTTYYYKVLAAAKGDGLTFVGEKSASVNAKVK